MFLQASIAHLSLAGLARRTLEWLEIASWDHNPDLIELTRAPSIASPRSDAKFREQTKQTGWRSSYSGSPIHIDFPPVPSSMSSSATPFVSRTRRNTVKNANTDAME